VLDLIQFLCSMGARIAWDGPATVAIQGVPRLHGSHYRVMPDRLEAATYLIGAAISRGDVTVAHCVPAHLRAVTTKLAEAGAVVDETDNAVRVRAAGPLQPVDIRTYRYPGYPTDVQQPFGALMTQAHGESSIQDTVFDDRMRYLNELQKLGATVELREHLALIRGPSRLTGAEVRALDLRAGAAVVLAGIAARGETIVTDAHIIERGYSSFAQSLTSLGASCVAEVRDAA
jgi:UDP-N-acetylglucosamine 1-carboxyvinyltransferase